MVICVELLPCSIVQDNGGSMFQNSCSKQWKKKWFGSLTLNVKLQYGE